MRKICPICRKSFFDKANKEAIEQWGRCLLCDHLQSDAGKE